MDTNAPAIQLSNLTKHFGATTALLNLDMRVQAGEIYGFLGPNGAGKTTTISCLMDFIRPNAGTIRLFGQPHDDPGLKRHIGYVPADPQLYPGLTGRRHLALYRQVLGQGAQPDAAVQLADRLGLNLDIKARALSTGNQQKLALALAMAAAPRLLILDEPTRGLDPLAAEQVYAELVRFKAAGGTVFISSHNLAEVQKICDRVGLIKSGHLVASSTLDSLLDMAVHEVRVTCNGSIKLEHFRLPGVVISSHSGHTLILRVTGDINPVIARLARMSVTDLEVGHASLEEIFAQYYEGGEKE
jgi:ABC-2 type transport system ATP-binding protein